MVTHGPAVHPGGSGGFTFDLMTGTTFASSSVDLNVPAVVPAPQLILRQGGARGPFGTPAHIGFQLQPFALIAGLTDRYTSAHEALLGSDLDLYTQLRSGGWDRGVGLLAGIDHIAAYYETGPPLHGGGSWYVAHQATLIDTGVSTVYALASTLARTESGFNGRAANLGLTVVLGGERRDPNYGERGGRPFLLVIGSMSIDFFHGGAQKK